MDDDGEQLLSELDERQRDDRPPNEPNKRLKTAPVPRKPACQTCRRRKVRCDNNKPACGFCHSTGSQCSYPVRGNDSSQGDLSLVLDRLDTLSHAVENIQYVLASQGPSQVTYAQPTASGEPQLSDQSHVSFPVKAAEWQKDYLQIPASRCSADNVLTWPIFRGQFRESSLITTLFQHSHGSVDERSRDEWTLPEGFRSTPDEHIPRLVDRFIQNVHTKNPILDLESLIQSGRHAAEFGVQWDAKSCLILLACALGCVSNPFSVSTQDSSLMSSPQEAHGQRFSTTSTAQLREGDAFFTLACRRLGLLRYSVIGAQCHFFAGVYLMYMFRPLPAWNHFYQASTFYRLRLRLIDGLDKSAYQAEPHKASVARRLEQSLYWSCFKSEVEIRVELPLPQSAIAEYEYPDLFPTPPTLPDEYPSHSEQPTDNITPDLFGGPSNDIQSLPTRGVYNQIAKLFNEEQSWYYYLTEVALRRIGNRVLNAFYREESSTWSNIKPLIPIALEFESQIDTWLANLPPAMKLYDTDTPTPGNETRNSIDIKESISMELRWAVSNRFLEIRLWLYQPFLYHAIHLPASSTIDRGGPHSSLSGDELEIIQRFVDSGLNCCMKILQARCLRHRHHGIWFDLRALVTASLIFIALARSENTSMPNLHTAGLRNHLNPTLEALTYWEDEALDIKKARLVLDDLLEKFDESERPYSQ